MEGIHTDPPVEVLCRSHPTSSGVLPVPVDYQQLCKQEEEARSSLQALETELSSLKIQKHLLEEEFLRHHDLRVHASFLASRAAEAAAGQNFSSRGESWAHARTVQDKNAAIEKELRESIAAMAAAEEELNHAINLTRQTLLELRRTRLLQKVELTAGGLDGGYSVEGRENENQEDKSVEAVSDPELDTDCFEVKHLLTDDVVAIGDKTDSVLTGRENPQEVVVLSDDEDDEAEDISSDIRCLENDLAENEITHTGEGGGEDAKWRISRKGRERAVRCFFPVVDSSGAVQWKLGLVRALLCCDSSGGRPLTGHRARAGDSREKQERRSRSRSRMEGHSWETAETEEHPGSSLDNEVATRDENREDLNVCDGTEVGSHGMMGKAGVTKPYFRVLVTEACPTSQKDVPCRRVLEGTKSHAENFHFFCYKDYCTSSGGSSAPQWSCLSPTVVEALDAASKAGLEVGGNVETVALALYRKGLVGVQQTEVGSAVNGQQNSLCGSEAEAHEKFEPEGKRNDGKGRVVSTPWGSSPFVASATAVEDAAGCPYKCRCRYSHGMWLRACDVCVVNWDSARALQAMLEAASNPTSSRSSWASLNGGREKAGGVAVSPPFVRGKPVWLRENGSSVWLPGRLLQAIRKQRGTAGGQESDKVMGDFLNQMEQAGEGDEMMRKERNPDRDNCRDLCMRSGYGGERTQSDNRDDQKGNNAKSRGHRIWSTYARVAVEDARTEGRKRIVTCRAEQVCPRVVVTANEPKEIEEKRQVPKEHSEQVDGNKDETVKETKCELELSDDVISIASDTEPEEETSGEPDEDTEGDIPWEKLRRLGSMLGVDATELRDTLSTSVRPRWQSKRKTTPSTTPSPSTPGGISCPLSSSAHFGCWMLYTSGMGLRVMQKWGYRPGECLGKRHRLQRQQKTVDADGGGEATTQSSTSPTTVSGGGSCHPTEESSDEEGQMKEERERGEQVFSRDQGVEEEKKERNAQEKDNDQPLPALINPLGIRILPPRLALDFISDPEAWPCSSRKRRRQQTANRPAPPACPLPSPSQEGMWNYAEGALLPSFGGVDGVKTAARKAQVENDGAFNLINNIYAGNRGTEALGLYEGMERNEKERTHRKRRWKNDEGGEVGRCSASRKTHQVSGGGERKDVEVIEDEDWLEEVCGRGERDLAEERRRTAESEHREKLQALRRNKTLGETALRRQLFQVQQQQRSLKKEVDVVSANRQRHVEGESGIGAFASYYGDLQAAKLEQLRRMKEEETVLLNLIEDKAKEKKLKVF
ncbi:hypothetical protein CSUI_011179 [Cystoisospora suis]|uniref:G-patch domain-containing protein n=1 Tax=Cystoisospora suis TaxID=483139 RepID=A0A2C6JTW2_9APIC|nr:hypothetical protein CSUI_011179 [Cystoisospora suis]